MQYSLQLKRDTFRQGIRRAKIKQITAQRRLRIIEVADSTPIESQVMDQIYRDISRLRRQPYKPEKNLLLLQHLHALDAIVIADPEVLSYLNFVAKKRLDNDLSSEQEVKLQGSICQLLYRLLSTRQAIASNVIDRIIPLLEILDSLELFCVISGYRNASIKTSSYEIFLEMLARNDILQVQQEFISQAFETYILRQPRVPYTQAANMFQWLDHRLHLSYEIKDQELVKYLRCLIELSKEEYQVKLMTSKEGSLLVEALLGTFRKTQEEDCINNFLKLIAMWFRSSAPLSNDIFRRYYNFLDYIGEKVDSDSQVVVSWCLYAVSNICANGKDIIKDALNSKFVLNMKDIYEKGNSQVREEVIYLLHVIFQHGGHRQRLLLFENNLVDVLADAILYCDVPDTLVKCIKCLVLLFDAAIKLQGETQYVTAVMHDLLKRPGLRDRLEDLCVSSASAAVSSQGQILLQTYLDRIIL